MSTATCFAPAPRLASGAQRRTGAPRPVVVAPSPARPSVRLTGRGRAVLALLCLALVVAALAVLKAPATASSPRDATGGPVAERVTVHPGETLWGIASRVRPNADPRATIARIKDMNGLTSSTLPAGRVLLVPAGR
jgi:LysM domain-containing protein